MRADDLAQTQADQGALGVNPTSLFIWDLGLFLSYCYLDIDPRRDPFNPILDLDEYADG